jgi:uncharacterized protein with ParB-like and HNH nuclease domain
VNAPIGLDTLFKQKLFRIPDYQRGYAWQKSHCKDFWEDLINLQPNRSHYTGVITLKEVPPAAIPADSKEYWLVEDHSYKMYHIVDGQQRLTTSIIFLQALIEFVKGLPENSGKQASEIYLTPSLSLHAIIETYICKQIPTGDQFYTYKFGYTVDNPSYEYMRHRIFNEPDAGTISETFYTLNLKNAKEYFLKQLAGWYDEEGYEGITTLYKKISKRFLFNEYVIEDEFDVFVAFETMNNRGKDLSKLELLKNRLIYLSELYPDSELDKASRKSLRDDINKAWKEVYYQLGRNESKPLNDDDFLRAHWILSFSYTRKKGNDYINFLLKEYFTPKNIHKKIEKEIILSAEPEEVRDDLEFAGDEPEQIEDEVAVVAVSALDPKTIRDYVKSLRASAVHWFNSHYPYMAGNQLTDEEKSWIDKLNRIGMGYFRPLVMSILKNISHPAERILLLQRIEKYIFVCFQLSQAQRNYGDSEFYRASRELDKGVLSVSGLTAKLDAREAYSYHSDGTFNTKFFSDYLYKKFNVGDRAGYYYWHGLKYFLYEYELKKMAVSGQKKVDWELFIKGGKDLISIEHIFPQTPTEYWKDAFAHIDEDQWYLQGGALGNLLLLSRSINSSLQNDSYPEKLAPKFNEHNKKIRMGYRDGSHSEIDVSLKYPKKWTDEEIEARGLELLEFMEERWNLIIGDEEKKKSLLTIQADEEN